MTQPGATTQRVKVWFGDHVICTYEAEAEQARRYAAAMRTRFAGLRITAEPVPAADPAVRDGEESEPLPDDSRLWPLTVR